MTMSEYISKAPVRRAMKSVGAYLVSEDALKMVIGYLEKLATEITKKAVEISVNDGRKKLIAGDIMDAIHVA